jgi:inhibitor of KinA
LKSKNSYSFGLPFPLKFVIFILGDKERVKISMEYTIHPLSEEAILIHFGQKNHELKVKNIIYQIEKSPFVGFRELIPAYTTITIYYDPFIINHPFPFQLIKGQLEIILNNVNTTDNRRNRYFEIPVCYEDEFALDLKELATSKNLSENEVVQLHTSVVYDVIFIGFSPGFPFLSGLNQKLHFPRKASPRLKVNQGSVGIAGNQTGIYSLDSPGGWQILGRTPVKLFNIKEAKPTLLKAGDQVMFYPISQKEFYQWEDQPWG